MPYKFTYTDEGGACITLLQLSDVIYEDILHTVDSAKDDREALTAVCDLFPDDLSQLFRRRFKLEEEN